MLLFFKDWLLSTELAGRGIIQMTPLKYINVRDLCLQNDEKILRILVDEDRLATEEQKGP